MVRVKVRIRVWLEFGLCWVSVSGKESFYCSTLVFFCDPIVLLILVEPYYYRVELLAPISGYLDFTG